MRRIINISIFIIIQFFIPSVCIAGTGTLNDYNPYNVSIPDNGSSVNSDLSLSGAPSDATISKVKIYYEIRHTYIGDLKVWLTTYYNGAWHDFVFSDRQGGSDDNIIDTRDNLTTWNGASPNQTWYLVAQDMATGDTGYIDFFELWIDYEFNLSPSIPSNPDPYDEEPNVSINNDLDWTCQDSDGDTLYYTVYFEKDDSTPNNIAKNDSTGSSVSLGTLDYGSHYYWQVKADDHKDGVTYGPVWEFITLTNPYGNLNVSVSNWPGGTGRVVLYRDGNSWQSNIGSDGVAHFTEQTAATNYYYEVYYNGPRGEEYWGDKSNITIPSGGATVNNSFTRFYPYATSIVLKNNNTNETIDPQDSIELGTTVRAEVTIYNGLAGQSLNCYVQTIYDINQESPYDGQSTSQTLSVAASSNQTFTTTFTPNSDGNYYKALKIFSWVASTFTLTDGWAFDQAFTVNPFPENGEIIDVEFDKTSVTKDSGTITASITVQNNGGQTWTYYIGGSSILDGGTEWHDWTTTRTSITLTTSEQGQVQLTWTPSAAVDEGSYGFYAKLFKYSSGDEFFDENWIANAFDVTDSSVSVMPAEIIVRLGNNFSLHNPSEIQNLLNSCLEYGIPAISLMIHDDQMGWLYYPSSVPYTQTCDGSYGGYEDYTDQTYIENFISEAHKNGIKVYAWFQMFEDKILYDLVPEFRLYNKNEVNPINNWVSPVIEGVRSNRKEMILDALSRFSFDGLRIDHCRYNDDWEDWSSTSQSQFEVDTGIIPSTIACCGDSDWLNWVDWRADIISSFNEEVRNLATQYVDLDSIGAYVFPDSASEGEYYDSTWSGQRFEDYGTYEHPGYQYPWARSYNLEIHPMPMIYWQDWSLSSLHFQDYVNENLRHSKRLSSPTEVIPVFSVTDNATAWGVNLSETEIKDYMQQCGQLCKDNGIKQISYFYFSAWSSTEFERLKASYIDPVPAITPGFIDFGDVPVGTSLNKTFILTNVGNGTLTTIVSASGAFSIIGDRTFSLSAGETANITIVFTPSVVFTYESNITFTGDNFIYSRTVTGDGVSNITPPIIETINDHSATENVVYNGPTPSLSMGTLPVEWFLEDGPSGMTINSNTGVVSWTVPIVEGSPHTITIRASNTAGSDDESWQLSVMSSVEPPIIDPISDNSIIESDAYTGPTPTLSSGTLAVTWSLIISPTGMTIDETTGVVSWPNPTLTDSPHLITIRATNDAGSDDESWYLAVTEAQPATIALINPDNNRILKFGIGNWLAENNDPPCEGPYYSAACGTIGDQCGSFLEPDCWSEVGQQPDFIAEVLRDNGFTVDEFSTDSFPDSSIADYDVVIVQDPLIDNIREFPRSVETSLPDLLESVANEIFVTKLNNYFNTGGKIVLVGDAVRLLEASTAQKPTLDFGKTILTDQVANSSSHDCAPTIWPFIRANPFCCTDRSGTYSYQISSTLLSLTGTDISDLILFNGNDLGPAQIWSDTVYYPEDGISLLDIYVSGSGNFVTRGDTCSPPVYTATVDDVLSHFMGYTTYNGKNIYYIGSDSFWDYQVRNYSGAWHCSGDDWAEIKNQITQTGKEAIVKLIQTAIQSEQINPLPGDIDYNGIIDLGDAIISLQVLTGADPLSPIYVEADVNGDGKIGIEEAIYILEETAGLNVSIWTDDFSDGNYTENLSWIVDNGNFVVDEGALTESEKGTNYSASIHTVVDGNVTSFQVDFINPPQGLRGEHHMCFYLTDNMPLSSANGYMMVLYWDSVDWGEPTDYMDLIRIDNGVHTVIDSGAVSAVTRDAFQHTVKLIVKNGEVKSELDGVEKNSATDSTYSEFNRVSIDSYMKYYDIDATYDNVIIEGTENHRNILLEENFDTYSLNTWPSPDWIKDANANSDPGNNLIVLDPADSDNKVLKLFGSLGGCWSSIGYMPFFFSEEFTIETKIYNGSELLSGCHPGRGRIVLRHETSWTNYGRGLILFHGNGQIIAEDGSILQEYQSERWYNVKIKYTRIGNNLSLHYWIDNVDLGQIQLVIDDLGSEISLDHIGIIAQEGTAYFDDVHVYN